MKEVQAVINIGGQPKSPQSAYTCLYDLHGLLRYVKLDNVDVLLTVVDWPQPLKKQI